MLTKQYILDLFKEYSKEMEAYSYFGSNPGISEEDYEELADKILIQLENSNEKEQIN